MKKLLCILAVAVLCSGMSLPVQAKMVWKFSTFFDETHALTRGAITFKEELEKRRGNEVEIRIFTNNQLGDGRENLEGLQSGTLELAEAGTPWCASFSDAFFALNMPYLFLERATAYAILDGDIGDQMRARFEKQAGIKFLGYWENGIRHVTNSKLPITKPENLKGLKIRVQQDPVQIAIFRALGSNPTPMAFGEVFTALQQGVIDGQENPLANTAQRKFHEVQKYLSLTAHMYDVTGFYMNMELFEDLPADFQKDIIECAKLATDVQRKEAAIQDERYMKLLRDSGRIEILELTPDQRVPFKTLTAPVYMEVEKMLAEKDKEWAKIVPTMLRKIEELEGKK